MTPAPIAQPAPALPALSTQAPCRIAKPKPIRI